MDSKVNAGVSFITFRRRICGRLWNRIDRADQGSHGGLLVLAAVGCGNAPAT